MIIKSAYLNVIVYFFCTAIVYLLHNCFVLSFSFFSLVSFKCHVFYNKFLNVFYYEFIIYYL